MKTISTLLVFSFVMIASSTHAANCKAEPQFNAEKNFVGCKVTRNNHAYFVDAKGINRLACETTCNEIPMPSKRDHGTIDDVVMPHFTDSESNSL